MYYNIIANLLGRIWGTVSNFLFIPLYIHYLGFDNYSVISFTLVIAGFMMIIDAGISATLSREFSRMDNTHEEKVNIFYTFETLYLIILIFFLIVVLLLAPYIIPNLLNFDNLNNVKILYLTNIISVEVTFQLLIRFYMGGMLGLEKQILANIYQVGWGVLRNGFVVFVIMSEQNIKLFFLWQCFSTILFAMLFRMSLCKLLTGKRFNIRFIIEFEILKRTWKFAAGMFLVALVAAINTQLDKLIISIYMPLEILGYYTLAVSLAMGLVVVVNPIATALLPKFTGLYSSGKAEEAANLYKSAITYISVLVFSLMSNMILNTEELLWIWTGNAEISNNASTYLSIIALSMSMLALQILPFSIAVANGYTKLNNIIGFSTLIITLPGYLLTTKVYGAIGCAVIFCLVQFLTIVIYIYHINRLFIKQKNVFNSYVDFLIFPFVLTVFFSYLLNLLMSDFNIEYNRFYEFIIISFNTIISLILTYISLKSLKRL